MMDIPTKEREVRVGDVIPGPDRGFSPLIHTVIRVTAKYLWLEYHSLSGEHYTIKRNRDIILMGTKYY